MAEAGWASISEMVATLTPSEEIIGGWAPISEMVATLTPSEEIIGGWALIGAMVATLTPSEEIILGWKLVSDMTTTLGLPTMCSTDADCREGYVCRDGVCIKEGEGGTGWIWGVIAVAAGATAVIVATKKKPKEK